jgi:hypothetical protein
MADELSGNLFEAGNIDAALAQRRRVDAPSVVRLDQRELAGRITKLLDEDAAHLSDQTPTLELSARVPYAATLGRIDSYHPGRWDTESNLVFMSPIVQTGPSPGEWDGTVIYAVFNPPATGTFLIVANFSGYDTTMHLNGPWGDNTAYTAQTSDSGAAVALWTGGSVSFTLICKGSGLGYLESIQVFAQ